MERFFSSLHQSIKGRVYAAWRFDVMTNEKAEAAFTPHAAPLVFGDDPFANDDGDDSKEEGFHHRSALVERLDCKGFVVPSREEEEEGKGWRKDRRRPRKKEKNENTKFEDDASSDKEEEEESDDEMRHHGSSTNHLLMSLESLSNVDCSQKEEVRVTARISDRNGNLKGKRCIFSARKRTENGKENAIVWGGETRDLLCRDGLTADDRLVVEASVSNENVFGSMGLSKMMSGTSGKDKDKSCTQKVIGYGICSLREHLKNGDGFDTNDNNNFIDNGKTLTLIVPLRMGLSNTKNASRKCQAVVRVLFGVIPAMKKRIYLFRHGESTWNEAQRNVNVRTMMANDHPLTEAGVAQCMKTAILASKPSIPTTYRDDESLSSSESWVEVYANTYHVIVSPLTRAVQTAMILLEKHPATMKRNADVQKRNKGARGAASPSSSSIAKHLDLPPLIDIEGMNISGSPSAKTIEDKHDDQMWPRVDFRFSRACREIKSVGGLDSVGLECGETRIFKRASEKLKLLNVAETQRIQDIVDIFSETKCSEYFDVDSRDVRDKWWISADDSDSSSSLVDERTKQFWKELKNSSHASVSVVSHSDFIRKLLRQTTDGTRAAQETLKKARERKICNAGCIGLDVMFNPRNGNIEVLECELLFGTTFQD